MAEHPVTEVEEWREIPGHAGYEASSLGHIRSIDRTIISKSDVRRFYPGALLRQYIHRRYHQVSIGRHIAARVNILVCAAFWGKRPSRRHHAAHRNGDRLDNRAENLQWATPRQNKADEVIHGTRIRGVRHPNAKLTEQDVRAIRLLRSTTNLSYRAIGERFGVSKHHAIRISKNYSWQHVR